MTTTKNGTTVPKMNLAGSAVYPSVKKDEEVTPDAKLLPVKKPIDAKDQPALEDRILHVQKLSDLVVKHGKLCDTVKKLNSFKLSNDGREDRLTIEDGEGNEFSTSNTTVIAKVLDVIKEETTAKRDEVANLITF